MPPLKTSPNASIEDEAERLYPFVTEKDVDYFNVQSDNEMAQAQRSAHITCARQYMDTIERLKDVLHIDQTGLAAGLAEVNKIVEGYRWVTEGRGPYEWNDDKYKEEMGNMLDNISEAATKALNSSGAIAHSVCCGKEGRTATMEGIGYIKKDAHDKEIEKLRAENEKMAEAVEILTELCALKKYKDSVGKDSHYEQEQPKAWKRANELLARIATEALK